MYYILRIYVDDGGYVREPPGRLIEIDIPRHANLQTKIRRDDKTHSQTKQILACHVDELVMLVLRRADITTTSRSGRRRTVL